MFGKSREDIETANMATVRLFAEDFLGKADFTAADAAAAPGIQGITGLKPTGPIDGLDEYKQTIAAFVAAFPAVEPVKIIDQFASHDRVVTRFIRVNGTRANFSGVAATDRIILFDETHVARLHDGKIVENIVSATNLEFEMLMAPVLTPLILK